MRHWHRRLDMLADKDKEKADQGEIGVHVEIIVFLQRVLHCTSCLLALLLLLLLVLYTKRGSCHLIDPRLYGFFRRSSGDVDQDGDEGGKDDEEGGDDGGDGKFEYVTSNEKGSSQVSSTIVGSYGLHYIPFLTRDCKCK